MLLSSLAGNCSGYMERRRSERAAKWPPLGSATGGRLGRNGWFILRIGMGIDAAVVAMAN